VITESTAWPGHDVTIRPAAANDAGVVHELLSELATHESSLASVRVSPDDWAALLTDPRVRVVLAWAGDRPVGYVSAVRQLHLWSGREILALDDLYVRPEGREHGVGRLLMTVLAEHAAADGLSVIRWEMEPQNQGAQRFYRRLGAVLREKVVATWTPSAHPCPADTQPRRAFADDRL
jgi:ribosomal protein S18 acetylase RimI-like enzyme